MHGGFHHEQRADRAGGRRSATPHGWHARGPRTGPTEIRQRYSRGNHFHVASKFCNLAAGAGAAVKEINDEAISLQLCEKCQLTLDKLKRAALPPGADGGVSAEVKKSSDRVSRVLM